MSVDLLKNFFRFFILVLFQVLVVYNIDLGRFVNPFVYVMIILVIPFNFPKWLLLVTGFLTGLIVDMFYDTAGMHASATLFMAFCRPVVARMFSVKEGSDTLTEITIQRMGINWFASYSAILIFLHHLVLFYLETFSFYEFFSTFLRVILSSIASLILVIGAQYILYPNKEK